MSVETLSGFLEGEASAHEPAELKRLVQDKAQYCTMRFTKILEHVQEGREKDGWEYRDGHMPAYGSAASAATAAT